MQITQYKNKKGETRYRVKGYLGIDPLTGKKKEVTRQGFKTKRAAELAFSKISVVANERFITPFSDMTLNEFFDYWLKGYKLSVKPNSFYCTKSWYKSLEDNLGLYKIKNITPQILQLKINELYEKGKLHTKSIPLINRLLEQARKMQIISNNPVDLITKPKKRKVPGKKIKFLTKEELKEILEYTKNSKYPPYVYTCMYLLAYTGIRIGEAVALKWDDLDIENKTLTIKATQSRNTQGRIYTNESPKTSTSNRILPIDESTIDVLLSWKSIQNSIVSTPYIFSINHNKPLTSVIFYIHFTTISKNFNKHITPHTFRHTHCSLLFEAGASIKEIQERLGHSNPTVTLSVYTHLNKNKTKDTVNKFIAHLSD